MSRPQDKNLIPLTERSEEEAHAIRSAGGKASQEKRRERQMMADLLELYSGLPIIDKRKQNRLKKLGIPSEVLTQKMLVADALMRSAQAGNTYAIQLYMDITGETSLAGSAKNNNLLEAIQNATKEDVNTDDIPELQQAAASDADVVE